jgi:nitrate/TMAO reductase-like tetraheme cytochrome c subunit
VPAEAGLGLFAGDGRGREVWKRRSARENSSAARVVVAAGLALALLVAIGLLVWPYAGSASALPGNTCNPEPGHGTPGCHVAPVADDATDAVGDTVTSLPGTSFVPTTVPVPTTAPVPATVAVPTTVPVPSNDLTPATSQSSYDPGAPVPVVDKNGCLACHGDPDLRGLMTGQRPDGSSVNLYVNAEEVAAKSVHRFQDCANCHTAEPHDVDTPLTKLSLAQKCGSCHEYQYEQYIGSVHGAPQAGGNSDPATCTDCHSAESSPHTVERVLEPSATTYPRNIAETCGKCHDNPELMGKYGIVEKVYDSYMESFHGKAISNSSDSAVLGQLKTATCVNCHGAHNIKLVTDPDSPVAGMENLAKTCEQCHPGAGVEFASGFLGHKEADTEFIPQVYWGEKFFYWFTRIVLAGGVFLVVLPVGRMVVKRVKVKGAGKPSGRDQVEEESVPGEKPDEGPEVTTVEPTKKKDG